MVFLWFSYGFPIPRVYDPPKISAFLQALLRDRKVVLQTATLWDAPEGGHRGHRWGPHGSMRGLRGDGPTLVKRKPWENHRKMMCFFFFNGILW